MYKRIKTRISTKQVIVLTGLLAGMASLVAGCGGSGSGSESAGPAVTLGATKMGGALPVKATRWASVKYGGGGYVPGLIFHPTSPDVLYARTDMGGAYRWDAATSTWLPITDGFGASEGFFHGGESIALDPNDDKRIYLSTGMYNRVDNPGRLYISTDRGDNWQHVDLPFPVGSNNQGRAVGERMMVDPNNPAILFYASRTAGLWKSGDRGQTWQQVQSLSTAKMDQSQIDANNMRSAIGVEQVVFDTSTKGTGSATQTIYTAVAPDYAGVAGLAFSMYKSTDGGASWAGVSTPVTGYHIPHMVRARDGMMYVAFTKDSGPGAGGPARLYKFDGASWTLLKKYDTEEWVNFGIGGLSVSGTGATTRIALGVTNSWGNWEGQPVVQLSDDAGATWREISAMAPHPDKDGWSGWVDDVEIDPNNPERVLHVHGGGILETRNASAAKPTWNHLIEGIEETATLALMAPPPGAAYSLLRSTGDIGMHVQTELFKQPTRGPGLFGNGISADMAWSAPSYIAAVGTTKWNSPNVGGAYSTDSGVTWTGFAGNHPDALANQGNEGNIAVTKPGNIVWAPANSVPAYSTDNGATWTYTNLPALNAVGMARSYRVVADRKNPNKVYAYNSGGVWWAQGSETPRFFVSTDGGHTFTERSAFPGSGTAVGEFSVTSIAVNPNTEGDIWVADGQSIMHSDDAGVSWTKLSAAAPIWGKNPTWSWPEVYGATSISLGKAPAGAKYSASVYVAGVIGGVWGVYRSDDGGATWSRFNDDKHQYGGISTLAADQNVPGRLFISGSGRGVLFSY
ncbi:dockerin [Massilia sp. Root418]|uniref:dockerin n=1 Tax=Massilia sp. Root418 TaxID=1736532 RepID=UPI000A9D168D|nr:dockerin [Massilia sp. Root418]